MLKPRQSIRLDELGCISSATGGSFGQNRETSQPGLKSSQLQNIFLNKSAYNRFQGANSWEAVLAGFQQILCVFAIFQRNRCTRAINNK